MQHITGLPRNQMVFSSLEDTILPENPVRFIDAFVEALSLETLGFSVQSIKAEGRPSFDTKIFLKIYLYGYLNGLRSSRKLEKECARNIELQWLLCAIIPNYHSISDFRKQNPSGLKKLFKLFVSFLKDADLIGDSYNFKKYRTPKCKECPVKFLCTSRAAGREIDRSQYADAVEENNKRYHENPQLYRKRQEINEHIFGTIKRQWGYNHTNLTGLEKVNGEHSLIMLVYNIKRSINILGVPDLIAKLKKWNSPYKAKALFLLKSSYLKLNLEHYCYQTKIAA